MDRPRNKIAVIAGAAQGIGKANAERFSAAGAQLILADTDAERLAAMAKSSPTEAATFTGDVTDETFVMKLFAGITRLDILVNNLGGSRNAKLWDMTAGETTLNVAGGR
jgi:NADP-dependent 3-hydroxy acid dehydrogenase YdfG